MLEWSSRSPNFYGEIRRLSNRENPLSSAHLFFNDRRAQFVSIEMANTSYERFLEAHNRDAKRAYQHMDAEEREAFLRKLTEIDAEDSKDRQSPPSNLTPV